MSQNSQSNNKNAPSFFPNSDSSQNNQDSQMESKFQSRQELFTNEENFSQIKESTMSKELSLGENNRNKIFMQKRLNKKINTENNLSLFNVLKISKDVYTQLTNEEINIKDFSKIINLFRSQNIDEKFKGLIGLRKLLSIESTAPIQEIIDLNLVPELINLLDNPLYEFKYEATYCLCNIASGTPDQAKTIIIYGGIPKILNLLDCSIEEIKSQTIWLVSNLVSDSDKIRAALIENKIFDKILTILSTTNNESYINLSAWAISNFFKVKPVLNYDICKKAFNNIARAVLIYNKDDEDFITDVCFFFSVVTHKYKEFNQEIIDTGLLQKIIKFLDTKKKNIILTSLRIIGNIACTENANQTQKLIDLGVLEKLKYTLFNENISIRRESAFILSNIAAGTQKQIEAVIDQNFFQILYKVFTNDNQKVKKEAIIAIANMTNVEDEKYMKKIFEDNILMIILELLKKEDAFYILIGLEILVNIFIFSEKKGRKKEFQNECEKMGISDVLEKLQMNENQMVYEKTLTILERYFETEK
jgi:hypothetical protein